MPTSITERRHAGSFVISEQEGFMSRDEVTLSNVNADPDGDDLKLEAGTVLGKITNDNSASLGEDGDYVALNETQTDGSQTSAGILYGEVILAPGESKKVAIVHRLAEVRLSDLTWPPTYSAGDITAALAVLAASPYFIIGRASENDN